MKEEYTEWIRKNVTKTYGKCSQVTEKMVKDFPELKRVRGHYYCPIWGARQHWWCVTSEGNIVDPTADQFPSKGVMGRYEEWDESQNEPTSICPNCGNYCYDGQYVCSDSCDIEYIRYLNAEM